MQIDKILFYDFRLPDFISPHSIAVVWDKEEVKAFLFFTDIGMYTVEEKGNFFRLYVTAEPEFEAMLEKLLKGEAREVEFLGYRIEFLGAVPTTDKPFGAFVLYSGGKKMLCILFKSGIAVYGDLTHGWPRNEVIKLVNQVLKQKLEEMKHAD
ncbi:MAG: hypothetical protein QXG54_04725 [Desulfurococcaceae archaeon]